MLETALEIVSITNALKHTHDPQAPGGFEQLVINFANEKLQQVMTDWTLGAEQEEYLSEAIEWTPIEYPNNSEIVSLLERGSFGVLSLLDEVCIYHSSMTHHSSLSSAAAAAAAAAAAGTGGPPTLYNHSGGPPGHAGSTGGRSDQQRHCRSVDETATL